MTSNLTASVALVLGRRLWQHRSIYRLSDHTATECQTSSSQKISLLFSHLFETFFLSPLSSTTAPSISLPHLDQNSMSPMSQSPDHWLLLFYEAAFTYHCTKASVITADFCQPCPRVISFPSIAVVAVRSEVICHWLLALLSVCLSIITNPISSNKAVLTRVFLPCRESWPFQGLPGLAFIRSLLHTVHLKTYVLMHPSRPHLNCHLHLNPSVF